MTAREFIATLRPEQGWYLDDLGRVRAQRMIRGAAGRYECACCPVEVAAIDGGLPDPRSVTLLPRAIDFLAIDAGEGDLVTKAADFANAELRPMLLLQCGLSDRS